MTLQEYLDHRAAGQAVPAIGFVTLAVKLLKVRACHRYMPGHSPVWRPMLCLSCYAAILNQWSVDFQTSLGLGDLTDTACRILVELRNLSHKRGLSGKNKKTRKKIIKQQKQSAATKVKNTYNTQSTVWHILKLFWCALALSQRVDIKTSLAEALVHINAAHRLTSCCHLCTSIHLQQTSSSRS